MDSALVAGDDGGANRGWLAVTSGDLQLRTASGPLNGYVVWERLSGARSAGTYVDTVRVRLRANEAVIATFLDSLEIVDVATPTTEAAVTDLFGRGTLSSDQRQFLDRYGNNNGSYDLGDLLAWIQRNGITLTPQLMEQLRGVNPQTALPIKPKGGGGR